MGRKKDIEGQLNFLDMLMAGACDTEEEQVSSEVEDVKKEQESHDERQESARVEQMATAQRNMEGKKDARKSAANVKAGGFKECSSCWCATCEHSTVGGSVPRPLGDGMRPCPACELCIRAGKAEICVIGSADEGCRHRAEKEGLL